MWRFSRHNELQALRLGGFSLLSLAAPLLAAALVLSLGMVALKDRAVPRALRALKDATAKDAAREARRLRGVLFFNELGRRQWVIGEVDADHPEALRSPEVIWERADRSRHLRLTARRALHADGVWWFTDASLQTFDEQGHPVAAAGDRAPAQRPLAEFRELDEDPLDFVYESVSWDSLPTAAIRRHVQRRRDVSPQDRAQWKLHLHQRLSLPWACLIVTLFAIPAGMRGGRQRAVAGVLLAVGFFFGYYALMNCGTLLALRMLVPPWLGAWLSNIVFLGAGATLLAVQR
jgi:lipopolysaccharide export LptBFGC system permease protein LptF